MFWSPSANAKPSETRKVCRKGDIHGRVTEGHICPEMKCVIIGCKKDICMAKEPKGHAGLPMLLVY